MKDFPIDPDVVILAAMDKTVYLTIGIECNSLAKNLENAAKLERLLWEMVDLGLIIKPRHQVNDSGE